MKILVDGRVIQDRYHGIGRHTFELVRALSGGGDELHVLDPGIRGGRLRPTDLGRCPDVVVHPFRSPVISARAQVEWDATIRRVAPDVVFAPYHLGAPLLHPGTPTVAVLHDCIFEAQPDVRPGSDGLGRRLFARGYRSATRIALHRATAVATVSDSTRQDLRRHYGLDVPASAVLPHGVGRQFFLESGPACTRPGTGTAEVHGAALAAGRPQRYVLHVGVRRPHKNHATLVHAFARLRRRVPDAHLVCVGQQDERFPDRLPELVEELGLADRVQLWSNVDDDLLLELYRHASAFAFPSLIEGFGMPLLEAMAAGVPVVASDAAAVVEASDGAADVVPARDVEAWADAVTHVLVDEDHAAALRAKGRVVAAEHTWALAAARTRRFLGDVVGARQETLR